MFIENVRMYYGTRVCLMGAPPVFRAAVCVPSVKNGRGQPLWSGGVRMVQNAADYLRGQVNHVALNNLKRRTKSGFKDKQMGSFFSSSSRWCLNTKKDVPVS